MLFLYTVPCCFCIYQHGRAGLPKQRLLVYDESSRELRWKGENEKKGIASAFLSAVGVSSAMKTASGDKLAPGIGVSEIQEIHRGVSTEVLLKAKLVDPGCCISIVTKERTLDLTLPNSAARDIFLRGLKGVLEENNLLHSVKIY